MKKKRSSKAFGPRGVYEPHLYKHVVLASGKHIIKHNKTLHHRNKQCFRNASTTVPRLGFTETTAGTLLGPTRKSLKMDTFNCQWRFPLVKSTRSAPKDSWTNHLEGCLLLLLRFLLGFLPWLAFCRWLDPAIYLLPSACGWACCRYLLLVTLM
jgi:hypothetical protein